MQTILTWYQSGGPFIVPLAIEGLAALLLLAERLSHAVLRSKIHARPFMEKVISLVRAGKLDEALKLCAEHRSAIPDLGLVILRSHTDNEANLRNVAEAAARTVIPSLSRRNAWLPVLAHIAVLLGVLGAIANLHEAFTGAASAAMMSRALPDAIAYALRPLGVGILTAIPLIAGHALLVHDVDVLTAHLEEFAVRLVNALTQQSDVRLGHRD